MSNKIGPFYFSKEECDEIFQCLEECSGYPNGNNKILEDLMGVMKKTVKNHAGPIPRLYVTVEIMPEWARESHRVANNWGVYPHNGAVRMLVTLAEANEFVMDDKDGYNFIVEENDG